MDVSDTEDKNTQALIDSALFWKLFVFCSWWDSVTYVQKSLKINIFKQFQFVNSVGIISCILIGEGISIKYLSKTVFADNR